MGRPRTIPNLVGQSFERLTVLEETTFDGRYFYRCSCSCGGSALVLPHNLTSGNSKSCGCLAREMTALRSTIHGHARRGHKRTPTMISWEMMWARCTDQNHKAYKDYGAKGITICERWESFANFLEDMGERPTGKTLDRFPNGGGNYEPDNCRWATPQEQQNNLRSNRPITFRGRTQNIKQWATELSMSHQAINYRLDAGWTLEEAFTRPLSHANGWNRGVR